jgi:hypothetical protein
VKYCRNVFDGYQVVEIELDGVVLLISAIRTGRLGCRIVWVIVNQQSVDRRNRPVR